jgi:hypothetical protein
MSSVRQYDGCCRVRAAGSRLLTAHTPWWGAGTSPAAYLFDTRGLQSDHAIRAQILPEGAACSWRSAAGCLMPCAWAALRVTVWSATGGEGPADL